jgi:Fe-S-cluster containining protein
MTKPTYDCRKCPGFCCSYPIIPITRRDLERLASHFGLDVETAAKRFTKPAQGRKYVLRRQPDEHFGRICRFFDTEKRRCTIYEVRPSTCREYPTQKRCGYYDFLSFERSQQGDKAWVARTDSADWK